MKRWVDSHVSFIYISPEAQRFYRWRCCNSLKRWDHSVFLLFLFLFFASTFFSYSPSCTNPDVEVLSEWFSYLHSITSLAQKRTTKEVSRWHPGQTRKPHQMVAGSPKEVKCFRHVLLLTGSVNAFHPSIYFIDTQSTMWHVFPKNY